MEQSQLKHTMTESYHIEKIQQKQYHSPNFSQLKQCQNLPDINVHEVNSVQSIHEQQNDNKDNEIETNQQKNVSLKNLEQIKNQPENQQFKINIHEISSIQQLQDSSGYKLDKNKQQENLVAQIKQQISTPKNQYQSTLNNRSSVDSNQLKEKKSCFMKQKKNNPFLKNKNEQSKQRQKLTLLSFKVKKIIQPNSLTFSISTNQSKHINVNKSRSNLNTLNLKKQDIDKRLSNPLQSRPNYLTSLNDWPKTINPLKTNQNNRLINHKNRRFVSSQQKRSVTSQEKILIQNPRSVKSQQRRIKFENSFEVNQKNKLKTPNNSEQIKNKEEKNKEEKKSFRKRLIELEKAKNANCLYQIQLNSPIQFMSKILQDKFYNVNNQKIQMKKSNRAKLTDQQRQTSENKQNNENDPNTVHKDVQINRIRKIIKRSPYGFIEIELRDKHQTSKITNLRILKPKQLTALKKISKMSRSMNNSNMDDLNSSQYQNDSGTIEMNLRLTQFSESKQQSSKNRLEVTELGKFIDNQVSKQLNKMYEYLS